MDDLQDSDSLADTAAAFSAIAIASARREQVLAPRPERV
jgi:hypothetical protein